MLGEDNDCTGEDNSDGLSKQTDGMKRVAARQLIERYYYQLTQGCGQNCGNVDCLSGCNMSVPLSPNEAAARALHLLKVKARLCETSPSKVARTEAMEVEPPCNEAFNQPQPGTSKTCMEHQSTYYISKMSYPWKRGHDDEDGGYRAKKRECRENENVEIEDKLESQENENVEIEDKLESLKKILRVGEKSTSSLESNLEGLASELEADLSTYKSKILKILVDCAVKLPDKCTIYTTLIGLLNTKNYNFGGECVELLVKTTKDCLKSCRWSDARFMLRFMADLVNCHVVSAGSLLQLLDNFVDAALEEGVPQVRRDWFAYSVLSALPWVGRELYEKKESELDRMLGSLEGYIKRRKKIHHAALRVFRSDHPHPQEEYLDCLWQQIKSLRSDMWIEKHIIRPYLAFDPVLWCEALQHNLPGLVPPPHHPSTMYPLPTVIFRMFDYTDCPAEKVKDDKDPCPCPCPCPCPYTEEPEGPILPGQHSIERWFIEEQLKHILMHNYKERKVCAARLLSYPLKNKIPLEYIIVEVMFGEIFRLPNPALLEIAYGTILIELCNLHPSTMPQVLAQATKLLYERIDTMNKTCFDRFVCWFAYHLSNFQFRWSWDDFDEALTLDPEHPKAKFIKEVLLKCLRLSYYQRVRDIVPESFSGFLPEKPEVVYKFSDQGLNAGSPPALVANNLVQAIKSKCTAEEVVNVLRELGGPMGEEELGIQDSPIKIEVFVQVLLNLGSKSFSHSFAAIAKFHPVFKSLAQTEESQICILRSMVDLWRTHQQMLVVLIDKMLKTQIVECAAVANWVFSKEMIPEFTKCYIWEIVHLTIRKMNKHVAKLQRDASDARRQIEDSDSDSSDTEDEGGRRRRMRPVDRPTEEQVEKLEERLEAAQADQKNLFLIIFQRFIMILSEHLVRCDTDAVDFKTPWYLWTVGRLHQIFMNFHDQVEKYSTTLETLLFTQDLDPNILDVFHQFIALRM